MFAKHDVFCDFDNKPNSLHHVDVIILSFATIMIDCIYLPYLCCSCCICHRNSWRLWQSFQDDHCYCFFDVDVFTHSLNLASFPIPAIFNILNVGNLLSSHNHGPKFYGAFIHPSFHPVMQYNPKTTTYINL